MLQLGRFVVHPWYCDVMGHLTTRHYSAFFDDASYHLLYEAFGFVAADAAWRDTGWADVSHRMEFRREAACGDLLIASGALTGLGGKSIKAEYVLTRSDGDVAATLSATTVFFDLKERRAKAISAAMRMRAEAQMARLAADDA